MGDVIKSACRVLMDTKRFEREIAQKSSRCLYQAAGYVRTVARRKIRQRNRTSRPGEPPSAHSKSFRSSIMFYVDRKSQTAVIGPMRLNGRPVNAEGTPVPGILEFGGRRAPSSGGIWYNSKVSSEIKTRSDASNYFQRVGYGPLYWGKSASVANRASNRGKDGLVSRARKRFSPIYHRMVWLVTVPIRSISQANRAARVAEEVYGYPSGDSRAIKVAARPFMGPSLDESKSRIMELFRDRLT